MQTASAKAEAAVRADSAAPRQGHVIIVEYTLAQIKLLLGERTPLGMLQNPRPVSPKYGETRTGHPADEIEEGWASPPPDVLLRDIVATRENSISDSSQIDLDVFCPYINQYDLKSAAPRIQHHAEIVPPGERGFDCKARAFADVRLRGLQNSSSAGDRECGRCGGLQCAP